MSDEPYEFAALVQFNSEVARGIMHTPEWVEKMAAEQLRFHDQQKREWIALGATRLANGNLSLPIEYVRPSRWWRWRILGW